MNFGRWVLVFLAYIAVLDVGAWGGIAYLTGWWQAPWSAIVGTLIVCLCVWLAAETEEALMERDMRYLPLP